MKKILAFAGSNSSQSINRELVNYTTSLLTDVEVTKLDISKWIVPIYSLDMDPDETPELISELIELISKHDGFILSSPEHNGGTPAFLKNIFDWLSRRSKNVFDGKPMLLMSTSPGQGGGTTNRKVLEHMLPYLGANISATYSLPSFYQNMEDGKLKAEFLEDLKQAVSRFVK
ncbi:NADPH-dependent FMN reductase [Carboxylicivirga sp. N1Y90]|uniref:NADPH-dependent FMN reductase n=1 Tax=Carboxylicivirga fragile TaxID=3417571 RepID=UPI003D337C25|nr:NAD(P)H-dependent oxidoreductase [Marinilabiliaceae bacterium N1Y90]